MLIVSNDPDENQEDDLEDELEKQWALQDQIHKKCKMKDDPAVKIKKWKEKYE